MINLAAVENGKVETDPFPFIVVSDFLTAASRDEILKDFPRISFPGSIPLTDLEYGPACQRLVDELQGEALRSVIGKKFEIDLTGRPTFITLRGQTREKDGRIHTDTKSKLITLLLYFNPVWETEGGRLRVLRSATNLDDYVQEISPTFGTCLIFKVTNNCWHGHKPYEGERLAIQLNYLTNQAALKQHLSKHHLSARWKKWKRWIAGGNEY